MIYPIAELAFFLLQREADVFMRKRSWFAGFLSGWVILGGIVLAIVLLIGVGMLVFLSRPAPVGGAALPAAITMIPAPTLTPPVVFPTAAITATATPGSSANGDIQVGAFVQITGTGGEGLRLRSEPGITGTPLFLGMDEEVFKVENGPRQADGYTWWYLVAPYDDKRSGWAASNYLSVIQQP